MDLFDVYPLYDITPARGQGCRLFDHNGEEYLDLYGGHAVISIGHGHSHYIDRIAGQLGQLGFYSNSVINPLQSQLADLLGSISGYHHYNLFLVNSGAEANENALKLASFANGRPGAIAFEGGFHGRTSGALAITDNPSLRAPFNSNMHAKIVAWEDHARVEEILKQDETGAVIVEGIQGISGIKVPSIRFLQRLRELCDRYEVALILDEIQSGYGRTGKFFAHQYADIRPDLITMAKGMGNGFPIGGVLIHPRFQAVHGQLGTTFGGSHLACSAGLAVLEVIKEEALMERAAVTGAYLKAQLAGIEPIKEIRGYGLMLGLKMDFDVKALRKHLLFKEKIFVGSSSDPQVLRLLPPLCLTKAEVDHFVNALINSLKHEELFVN